MKQTRGARRTARLDHRSGTNRQAPDDQPAVTYVRAVSLEPARLGEITDRCCAEGQTVTLDEYRTWRDASILPDRCHPLDAN